MNGRAMESDQPTDAGGLLSWGFCSRRLSGRLTSLVHQRGCRSRWGRTTCKGFRLILMRLFLAASDHAKTDNGSKRDPEKQRASTSHTISVLLSLWDLLTGRVPHIILWLVDRIRVCRRWVHRLCVTITE
jgi:hypothetical protein